MEQPLISVAGLHALIYCERLFYFEEVERIRVADRSVFAGRRLHEELTQELEGDWERPVLESATLGIQGAVDVLRCRNGQLLPYEHKRGRSAGKKGAREAWPSDRVQLGAYALLVEEAFGRQIPEARVRYHADNVTVRVPLDETLRDDVSHAIARARALAQSTERPPVTDNERLCVRCSLAEVCLPEESRLAADPEVRPTRLLPEHPRGQTLHVTAQGARVGRAGHALTVTDREGATTRIPSVGIGEVVLHGFSQISTQALRLCADNEIRVHWVTLGGGLVGSLAPSAESAQRHIRQFEFLRDPENRLCLSKRLVVARLQSQLRHLLRATRGGARTTRVETDLHRIRKALRAAARVVDAQELLGTEGSGAAGYFDALPELMISDLDPRLIPATRTRRPASDRFSTLLGFAYGMLYRATVSAIVGVGLHPGFGFYHRPRSSAQTLALDLMELFRVPVVDMAVVAALNRRTFDAERHFQELAGRVLLTEEGRSILIEVIERRMADTWRHDVVGYSLSYARMIELEVRLLEKEWSGEGGLFARVSGHLKARDSGRADSAA
ncbi:MAG: type I-MYXAN CRISPR-associated endonuclease Cas1 [Phycisphaerales bacterium]|nr:type I-MYXAN CRISPR-associated endonuclease Cas1 [Phycisphaerales bacterium]